MAAFSNLGESNRFSRAATHDEVVAGSKVPIVLKKDSTKQERKRERRGFQLCEVISKRPSAHARINPELNTDR